jgi:chitinase
MIFTGLSTIIHFRAIAILMSLREWNKHNHLGKIVRPHTNWTEITTALDLLWRNNIKPAKLNLGIGFYGRSFQLADQRCNKPGCAFLGGALGGPVC